MARVEVSDYVLWTKRIHDDVALQAAIEALDPGETIALVVNGEEGLWRKMRANRAAGYKTPGLTPLGPAKSRWGQLYREHKPQGGTIVEIALATDRQATATKPPAPGAVWASPSEADRTAAWEAVRASWSAGWRSEGPYGPREERHDRDKR